MVKAAVMCGGGLGAYDIVRTLGLAGIESAVFASYADDLAFRSRHARQPLLLPKFREENFQTILDRISAFRLPGPDPPVLFYSGDTELAFLSRFRDRLESSYRLLLPPRTVLEAVTSKVRFVDLARQAGLPTPPARAFSDVSELASGIDTIQMPCIVKPARNQDWFWETDELRSRFGDYKQALRRFDTADAVLDFCAALPRRPEGFVVQSYVDGADEHIASFHGYLDERSRCLGYFLTREIRTNPPYSGDSTYGETFHDETLRRLSLESLARIGFRGIVKIDYKWDDRARAYKMLEIEPHYQSWHVLGSYAGVNLALIAYRHQRGESVETPRDYADGVRLLHFSQDLKACLGGYRKMNGWSWLAYARSLARPTHYRVYDPDDPLPFFYSARRSIPRKLAGLARVSASYLTGRRWNPAWLASTRSGAAHETRSLEDTRTGALGAAPGTNPGRHEDGAQLPAASSSLHAVPANDQATGLLIRPHPFLHGVRHSADAVTSRGRRAALTSAQATRPGF